MSINQNGKNPYQPSAVGYDGPRSNQKSPSKAVRLPAILLIVSFGFGALVYVLLLWLDHRMTALGYVPPHGPSQPVETPSATKMVHEFLIHVCTFGLIGCGLAGAVHMLIMRNYPFALFAAVLATLGVSPFCLLTTPLGIWALVVLRRPEVMYAFHSLRRRQRLNR
jgi:hypothetical protein